MVHCQETAIYHVGGIQQCRDSASQEAFHYLRPVHLEISVTEALEEYDFKLYQSDDSLIEGGECFREKKLNC